MRKIELSKKKSDQRRGRVKAKIYRGGVNAPRLSVSKTNKHIFLQIIDDLKGVTLVSAYDKEAKGKTGIEIAAEMGRLIAKKAGEKKIKKIVFDRNRYSYHGVVKAIADGAREGGLDF